MPLCLANHAGPVESSTISVDVNLVVLHATVRDQQGGFVSGLRKDDFQVFESGRPQAIRLFRYEDLPVSVGLLVDNSGSMAPRRKDVAAAALAFVHSSNPEDELFVVNFNEKPTFGLPDTRLFSASPAELEAALNGVPAFGHTALYDAIEAGIAHLTKATRKKVLILISDGGDNFSHHKLKEVLDDSMRSNAIVYTIGLLDEHDGEENPAFLRRISKVTGGESYIPDATTSVVEICRRIARDIRLQYIIGYVPTNEKLDNTYRPVRVTAHSEQHKHLFVRTRAGYLASPHNNSPSPASREDIK